jgi:hypothetical protein
MPPTYYVLVLKNILQDLDDIIPTKAEEYTEERRRQMEWNLIQIASFATCCIESIREYPEEFK